MPIVTTYSGAIKVTAHEAFTSDPFYEYSKTLYGQSLGELFDNLVEASINITREAQNWVLANKPSDYKLSDDYWKNTIILPDVLSCLKEIVPTDLDSQYSSRIEEFKDIFSDAVCHRDSLIMVAVINLQLKKLGPTRIPSTSARDLSEWSHLDTYEEKMDCGWTGKELNEILEIAHKENRITALRAFDKYERRLAAFEMESSKTVSDSKTAPNKKKWWHF
jgi:hypothetical protein